MTDTAPAQHDRFSIDRVFDAPLDRGLTVLRLADDLEVGLGGEDHPEPGAHQLLVVGQQHPGRHASTGRFAGCSSA